MKIEVINTKRSTADKLGTAVKVFIWYVLFIFVSGAIYVAVGQPGDYTVTESLNPLMKIIEAGCFVAVKTITEPVIFLVICFMLAWLIQKLLHFIFPKK